MKALRRHLTAVPVIVIALTLVALFVLWRADATALDRLIRDGSGESVTTLFAGWSVDGLSKRQTSETVLESRLEWVADIEPVIVEPVIEVSGAPQNSSAGNSIPTHSLIRDHSGMLNWPRQFALAMIETGTNDQAIGGAGEVSRYQIMPSVWKHYSDSRNYRNPDIAVEVARQHWSVLHDYFKKQTGREPTDFDMYVLWNTRFGHYANRGFAPARLHPVVQDRAQRFGNLVQEGFRREAALDNADSAG